MISTKAGARIELTTVSITQDVGELSKLGVRLGYSVGIDPNQDMVLQRVELAWLINEIAAMVAVEATAKDMAAEDVLEQVRRRLVEIHFPAGKPSDARGIGEGHIEGH